MTELQSVNAAGWEEAQAEALPEGLSFCPSCDEAHDDEDLTDEDLCHRCNGGLDEQAWERRQMGFVNF